jgi:DNA transformation protein and related proteins
MDEFTTAIIDMLAPIGPIGGSRFFGGYGLKSAGVQFAMIFQGTLYLRVDEALAADLMRQGSSPFEYDRRDRRVVIDTYYSVPEDGLEDADLLVDWAGRSIAAAAKSRRPAKKRKPR